MQCSSKNSTLTKVNIKPGTKECRYTVKVINPEKKTSFEMQKLANFSEKFTPLEYLKNA